MILSEFAQFDGARFPAGRNLTAPLPVAAATQADGRASLRTPSRQF